MAKRIKLDDRELPDSTNGEEIFNMVSHIVGGALGIAAMVLCIIMAANHGSAIGVISSIIYGITLIDLDRIGGIVKSNQNERAHLLKESQCVIDEYIAETKKWLTSSRMDTTIQSLGKKCDEIVQDSYDYLNRKIDLSDHDRVILKKILKSSLHRLLKEPIEELKNVEENEQQQYKDMVERLFGL